MHTNVIQCSFTLGCKFQFLNQKSFISDYLNLISFQISVINFSTLNTNMTTMQSQGLSFASDIKSWYFPRLLHFIFNAFPSCNKCFLTVRNWIVRTLKALSMTTSANRADIWFGLVHPLHHLEKKEECTY